MFDIWNTEKCEIAEPYNKLYFSFFSYSWNIYMYSRYGYLSQSHILLQAMLSGTYLELVSLQTQIFLDIIHLVFSLDSTWVILILEMLLPVNFHASFVVYDSLSMAAPYLFFIKDILIFISFFPLFITIF